MLFVLVISSGFELKNLGGFSLNYHSKPKKTEKTKHVVETGLPMSMG